MRKEFLFMKLENKVVFVTGGSDGMGKATVLEAAREGAKVSFIGRNPEKCEKVLDLLKAEGLTGIYFTADVEKEDELKAAIRKTTEALGPIDVLINNVGYDLQALVHEVSSDKWDKCININLKAPFIAAREVLPSMMEHRTGVIINISSTAGTNPQKDTPVYSAAKAGLIMPTKAEAMAYGEYGIRINSVAPGLTETAMLAQVSEEYKAALSQMIPLKKPGQPIDIAKAVIFLASDDASYVTGQIWGVDGGLPLM